MFISGRLLNPLIAKNMPSGARRLQRVGSRHLPLQGGYAVASEPGVIRLAALADLHFTAALVGAFQPLFAAVATEADVLVVCGDLTDHGSAEEAQLLARELSAVKIPMVGVLGNHDFESGQQDEVRRILGSAGLKILDGDAIEIHGIGFAGAKGFAGGFDQRSLAPWGEETIKRFVHETMEEALKLESALAKLRTPQRIALLHYSPIRATVEGEPLEIYPFLGSSRLEEPINRYSVSAVFHGHAHRGTIEGRTHGNVPVYNVALPLLRTTYPDRPAFRLLSFSPHEPDSPAHARSEKKK
jgi:Icc-related predicted phosphoesterase